VAFKNKSKKQELLAHSLNAYFANMMVRKVTKTWKKPPEHACKAFSGLPQAGLGRFFRF